MFTNSSASIIRSISASIRWQLGVISILLASCGQGAEHKESNITGSSVGSTVFDTTLSRGIVKDTVACNVDKEHSFALYLPKAYNSQRPWPCIIFFDAHARGALPLRMYQNIAEKYGFILIGSNRSKNGTPPEVTNNIVNTLWTDIHHRLNIDTTRTYTSGFSGGSKVAALVAMTNKGISGVIGCAGGLPNTGQEPQTTFDYFGIAGDYDFNLPEMMQLDSYWEQKRAPHFLLNWPGIHSWPRAEEFRTGVLWMMVNSMKAHRMERNDAVITELTIELNKRINEAISGNDQITTARLLSGTKFILEGLTDVSGYNKQLTQLVNGPTYIYAQSSLQKLLQQEQTQQREMAAQFSTQTERSLTDKLTEISRIANNSKTVQEANSNRRVLAFLGFISYMNISAALSAGDKTHAATYIKIFKIVDPKNPDCSYFTALLSIKNNDTKAAMAALKDAAALGYSDVDQLSAEPAFASLLNDADFLKIVTLVRDNHDGKNLKN